MLIITDPHKATLSTTDRDQIGWDRSINKMLAFNQTDFLRVIHLDNDIVLYKHLDDLFLLPSTTVAMTRAYWLDEDQLPIPKGVVPEPQLEHGSGSPFLSTHLMVIEPSVLESARIWQEIEKAEFSPAGASMDFLILNKLYKEIAMVLPHRSLALRTGEFRRSPADHEAYLGMSSKIVSNITNKILTTEKWDNLRILREARLVHFSGDEPLPKPWIMWPPKLYRLIRPKCAYMDGTPLEADCEDREVWAKIYEGFRKKRKTVCALLMIPAPYWQPVEAEEPDVSKEEHS